MNHTFHYSLEKMQFFEAIFKIFAKTVFEVFEVKRGRMVKQQDFETEKEIKINVKNQISNFVYLLYCHFPTRNKSKSPLKNQKKSPRDYIGKGAFTM